MPLRMQRDVLVRLQEVTAVKHQPNAITSSSELTLNALSLNVRMQHIS